MVFIMSKNVTDNLRNNSIWDDDLSTIVPRNYGVNAWPEELQHDWPTIRTISKIGFNMAFYLTLPLSIIGVLFFCFFYIYFVC